MAENEETQAAQDGEKKHRHQIPEWRRYGDPRNTAGHFRPKKNLKSLYGRGKKWTRETLAEAMGIKDPTLISKWATGVRYMSDEDVVRCAMAASVSVSWLLDLTNRKHAQGWPNGFVGARQVVLHRIQQFSEGDTWEKIAKDYQEILGIVKQINDEYDAECLRITGSATLKEVEEKCNNEYDAGPYYSHICNEAYLGICSEWRWPIVIKGDEYTPDQYEELDGSDLDRMVTGIERDCPGDYRDPVHLAHKMLDMTMTVYADRCLEELSGLFNQASRMQQPD